MQEVYRDHVEIRSHREKGITPQQDIWRYTGDYTIDRGFWFRTKRVFVGTMPPLPENRFFDYIHFDDYSFNPNNPYVVGTGVDEERRTLFRNERLLVTGAKKIDIMDHNSDYTQLTVTSKSMQDKRSVHFFNNENAGTPIEGADSVQFKGKFGIGDKAHYALAASKGEETTIMIVDVNGMPVHELKTVLVPDLSDLHVEDPESDYSTIVWQANRDGVTTVYRNEEPVVSGQCTRFQVRTSGDKSNILAASIPREPATINLNGEVIFQNDEYAVYDVAMGGKEPYVVAKLAWHDKVDPEATVETGHAQGRYDYLLFYQTPNDRDTRGPYEDITKILVLPETIVANVKSKTYGNTRTVRIRERDSLFEGVEDEPVVVNQRT